ncbi:CPBP family intramembrane metalloprotease [Paeniglutamicibacter gangotriensis]|uniref:CPBP family intramembrane metalloprotease n=1 Tax=Paeniglutamicibacter gangotriensis TaxID=254787 RepID=A0A5B0E962_9MICC|nr:type II CAAX endopeptidase family protein [Paeniglutamicibacter gangotriensis]KAA0974039.1 CPBP family intramembrane metalloprotease [Paeniglutamicibacter gangotriensis]
MLADRNVRGIVCFVALAFGLSWLAALPLWLGDGLFDERFGTVALAVMSTPAIAALLMVFIIERPKGKARALGLWPLRPVGRLFVYLGLGLVVPVALVLVALPVGDVLGVYPGDFKTFSAFRMILNGQLLAAGQAELPLPIETLVALQFVNVLIGAFINLVPALGEELGWRGWMLPRLMVYGPVKAIVVSGVIWGAWHAPLVLLGYNYPMAPGWLGVLLMIGMCTLVGAVFGWLRLRSRSVWPAALAHGAFNAAAGFYLVFASAGAPVNTIHGTILGWSGWIIPLLLVVVLVATKQFRHAAAPQLPSQESAEVPASDR